MKNLLLLLSLLVTPAFAGENITGNLYVNGNVGVNYATPTTTMYVVGTSYFNGNVGIGIITPTTKLYVSGTTTTDALNIGIGTTSKTRLCIANNTVSTCP